MDHLSGAHAALVLGGFLGEVAEGLVASAATPSRTLDSVLVEVRRVDDPGPATTVEYFVNPLSAAEAAEAATVFHHQYPAEWEMLRMGLDPARVPDIVVEGAFHSVRCGCGGTIFSPGRNRPTGVLVLPFLRCVHGARVAREIIFFRQSLANGYAACSQRRSRQAA